MTVQWSFRLIRTLCRPSMRFSTCWGPTLWRWLHGRRTGAELRASVPRVVRFGATGSTDGPTITWLTCTTTTLAKTPGTPLPRSVRTRAPNPRWRAPCSPPAAAQRTARSRAACSSIRARTTRRCRQPVENRHLQRPAHATGTQAYRGCRPAPGGAAGPQGRHPTSPPTL